MATRSVTSEALNSHHCVPVPSRYLENVGIVPSLSATDGPCSNNSTANGWLDDAALSIPNSNKLNVPSVQPTPPPPVPSTSDPAAGDVRRGAPRKINTDEQIERYGNGTAQDVRCGLHILCAGSREPRWRRRCALHYGKKMAASPRCNQNLRAVGTSVVHNFPNVPNTLTDGKTAAGKHMVVAYLLIDVHWELHQGHVLIDIECSYQSEINRLQQIQNCLARTVVKAPAISHITAIPRSLHWLQINERIEYKLLSFTYKVLTTSQPDYLHNLISVQSACRTSSSSAVTFAPPSVSSSLQITNRSFR